MSARWPPLLLPMTEIWLPDRPRVRVRVRIRVRVRVKFGAGFRVRGKLRVTVRVFRVRVKVRVWRTNHGLDLGRAPIAPPLYNHAHTPAEDGLGSGLAFVSALGSG